MDWGTLDLVAIGVRIRKHRESNKISREKFAEFIGRSPEFVSQIENDKRGISTETLARIVETLHLSADYILYGVTEYEDMEPVMQMLECCDETEREYAVELIKTFLVAMRKRRA